MVLEFSHLAKGHLEVESIATPDGLETRVDVVLLVLCSFGQPSRQSGRMPAFLDAITIAAAIIDGEKR